MAERIVMVGAAGSGRELLDVVVASGRFEVVGVVDDSPSDANLERLAARGVRWLGDTGSWLASGDDAAYLVGIEAPPIRRRIDAEFQARGLRPATVVHPAAVIGTDVELGEGTVVAAGATISTNVKTGRNVHILANATIGHDVRFGDFSSAWPASVLSGEVVLRSGAIVGAGAVVLGGLTVGADALVGAAACVVRDVPDRATVKGVPAR